MLLRHLKLTYQAGLWTMLPDGEGTFEIHISMELRTGDKQYVMYYRSVGEPIGHVKVRRDDEWGRLKFEDIHGKKVKLIGKYSSNPSLRALYLKAEMAHRTMQELPDPHSVRRYYTEHCPKLKEVVWELFQSHQGSGCIEG